MIMLLLTHRSWFANNCICLYLLGPAKPQTGEAPGTGPSEEREYSL